MDSDGITQVLQGENVPDDLICPKEAALLANVSETYINSLARGKKIPYYHKGISTRRLYSKAEIEEIFCGVKRVGGGV